MLKSEVEKLLEFWLINEKFVFKTNQNFHLDYLVIKKNHEDDYECDKISSTTDLGSFNKTEMIRLIGSEVFVYLPMESPNQDFRRVRSGNCHCGAMSTSNPNFHAFYCPLYRKD
jgi:hypothetical protein